MGPGLFQRVHSVVGLDLGGCKHLFRWLPRIVSCGISFPFDEVLQITLPTKISMPQNVFHFEFLFSIYQFWGWSKVIGSLLFGHLIRGQQRGVKDIMDGPGRRELEFVRHWGDLLSDGERPMTFRSEFARLIRQG